MEKEGILQCDMSRQSVFVIAFDHMRLLAVGAALAAMIVLQAQAGIPAEWNKRILLIAAFFVVAYYFIALLRTSLNNYKDRTLRVSVTSEGELITESPSGIRKMKYSELLFTMTYTSFHTLSITYVGKTEYVTARMSNAYLFLKRGKEQFRDFYAIAAFVKENSPHNENIIVSRKTKKHPWIRIPKGVLETEFYSKRAENAISEIRKEYLLRLK